MESMAVTKGWHCSAIESQHFVCRPFFKALISFASDADALSRAKDEQGSQRCPFHECGVAYKISFLRRQPTDAGAAELEDTASGIEKLRMRCFANKKVEATLAQREAQWNV